MSTTLAEMSDVIFVKTAKNSIGGGTSLDYDYLLCICTKCFSNMDIDRMQSNYSSTFLISLMLRWFFSDGHNFLCLRCIIDETYPPPKMNQWKFHNTLAFLRLITVLAPQHTRKTSSVDHKWNTESTMGYIYALTAHFVIFKRVLFSEILDLHAQTYL